jgi:hypothetical protein
MVYAAYACKQLFISCVQMNPQACNVTGRRRRTASGGGIISLMRLLRFNFISAPILPYLHLHSSRCVQALQLASFVSTSRQHCGLALLLDRSAVVSLRAAAGKHVKPLARA